MERDEQVYTARFTPPSASALGTIDDITPRGPVTLEEMRAAVAQIRSAAAGEVHVFECATCNIECRVKPAKTVDLAVMRREVDLALQEVGCTHTGGVTLRFEADATKG